MQRRRGASFHTVTGSATERVRAALAAAHGAQATVNAFTSIDDERALDRAAAIDRGELTGPLAGVPIGLKDLIEHEGRVTTCGSAFYRHTATKTAPCVQDLEDAGAVIIGRTGLHEWAFGFSSENPHWGPVRNPWDLNTSPGGSSGGSAAAVAAGIVPIAIGTDTGGSVRVPSALCGTFGLKVTHGRISLDGVFPLVAEIDTVGPLADSIDGIETSYRAMSGDSTPVPDLGSRRFGVPQPWYEESPTDDEIAAAFVTTVEALRSLGHEVHAIEMPDVAPSMHLWNAIAEPAREVHRKFRESGEPYGEDIAQRLDDADKVKPEEADRAREWQQMIRTRFADALGTVDFLITPTVPVRRKVIGETGIGDRHYRAVLSYFSALVNHSLHPAIALPLANSGSPPASLQVIGSKGSETALIGLGQHLVDVEMVRFAQAPANSPIPGTG